MPQKIFFANNLKFLRERKRMTQETIAERLNISRKKFESLESGRVKSPQTEDLLNFSDFFKISVDSLLRIELRRLGELKLRELEAGNDVYLTGSNIRVLAITVNQANKENVEYVPVKAKAGYSAGYNDPEFIKTLPRIYLPNLPKGNTFRMFPITGDSMLPIPHGSDVLCSYVQNWAELKAGTLCIVILKGQQDFVFKQVTLQSDGLLLTSLNAAYKPYLVPIDEVLELWQFYSYQTKEVPEIHDPQQIGPMLKSIWEDIKLIKGKA